MFPLYPIASQAFFSKVWQASCQKWPELATPTKRWKFLKIVNWEWHVLKLSIFLGFTTYCIVGNDLKPIGYLGMDWNRGLLSHSLGKGMMMDEMENQSSLGMIWTSDSTTFSLEKHILVGDDFIPSFRKWIMMMVLGWLICNVVNPMRNHPQNYHGNQW